MAEWWSSLQLFGQIMFSIACCASVVLIIQLILLFVGMGASDADVDMGSDVEVDGTSLFNLKLFSIRGIMGFLAIGGWVGLLMFILGLPEWLSGLIAFVAGLATAVGIAFVYRWFGRMEGDGNVDIRRAVGSRGTVYIPIPSRGMGRGKVNVTLEERFLEYDAVTDESDLIPTNQIVEIVGLQDETTLIVKKV